MASQMVAEQSNRETKAVVLLPYCIRALAQLLAICRPKGSLKRQLVLDCLECELRVVVALLSQFSDGAVCVS